MSNITVKFIGREYSIPQDVLAYIDLLDFTNSVQKQLMSVFSRKLQNTDVGCIGDDDMADEIRSQVNRFIGKLCDQGIYNRTVNDYLNGNKGYQLISKVNDAALQKAKALLMQKLNTLEAGYTDAINKAEGSITGMGFSIWSGSFVNHAIYAAMQASTIDKQAKAAEAEYQRDMAALTARMDAQYNGEQSRYIKNVYIPQMEAALTAFAYELLDKYLSDLIANRIFDAKALDYVDIKRSNDLLDNLKLSGNKKAILENAFIACPYNAAVYMQAMKYELLDAESFRTAKIFKQDKPILAFFKEACGKISYPGEFNINYYAVNLLAQLSGKNPQSLLRAMTESYATSVVNAYAKVTSMLSNRDVAAKVMGECSEESILSGNAISKRKAQEYIRGIISQDVWLELTEKCGYPDLLDRIKSFVQETENATTKADVDAILEEKLYFCFEESRKCLAREITTSRAATAKRKAEKEKAEKERKKRNRTIAIIVSSAAMAIFAFIVLFTSVIAPNSEYKQAVRMYNNGDYPGAIEAFSAMQNYKDSEKRLVECRYAYALELYNGSNFAEAKIIFEAIPDYKDSAIRLGDCYVQLGDYQSAIDAYDSEEIAIPDGVTFIPKDAFNGCTTLTCITIPASVTSVGEGAFDGCENLVDVHIRDLAQWCQIKFEDLTSSPMHYGDNIYLNGELLTDIMVPDSLTQINEYAFASWDCLVSIVIGNNITSIDSWAFAFCDNLKSVTLPNNITNINESVFNDCISLTEITIPASVKSIGENAFYNCNALTDVKIPDNVETVGKGAFGHCDNLSTFSFPAGIKKVEGYMFYPCDTLATIVIPNSVTSVGKWALRECPELATIRFNGTISEWKSIIKEDEWDYEIGNYIVYCTDGQISAAQNTIFECKPGDVISLGAYEQDNNLDNGAEPIEWMVLERNGNRVLVISKYCLDTAPYNETSTQIIWERCTLRNWLNQTFWNEAFNTTEQAIILDSTIANPDYGDSDSETYNDTTDHIFLLSSREASLYFSSSSDRKGQVTDYSDAKGCNGYWWLRSSNNTEFAAYVSYDGEIYGEWVDYETWGVRPVMWIEISE